jgi:thymidylate synthase
MGVQAEIRRGVSLGIPTFDTFEDAYVEVLRHVRDRHEYINAPRGNRSRECLNVSFRLSDSRDRVPYLAARKVNIVFHFAEALWCLWGRDDVAMIAHYAPQIAAYSADGRTLRGSAYGFRLFTPPAPGRSSRYERLLELLQQEAASKRAVAVAFDPAELEVSGNPDVACMIALQFLVRDGRLHLVCYMRANDADQGLLSDVFTFTLLQEYTAAQLEVTVGAYAHHVGSMHIGDKDADRVNRVLAEADQRHAARPRFPVLVMPADTTQSDLAVLAEHEESLRLDKAQRSPARAAATGLAPYWQQILLLFEVHRQITRQPHRPVEAAVLAGSSLLRVDTRVGPPTLRPFAPLRS